MIYKNGKEISSIYKNSKPIVAIYKGAQLVWSAIRSCFGSGYWVNLKMWSNKDGWKN